MFPIRDKKGGHGVPPRQRLLRRATNCRGICAKYPIRFQAQRVKLFFQHFIALDRVAADLLVHVCGHAGEICDLRLEPRFAIAHGFS